MRALISLAVFALLSSGFSAHADGDRGPVDCKKAKFFFDKMICGDADLRRSDVEIGDAHAALTHGFTGKDRVIFVAGMAAWYIAESNCENRLEDGKPVVRDCVRSAMDQRLSFLAALKANPSLLKSSVADYQFIHPAYLNQFAQQYDGKTVSVLDGIDVAGCWQPGAPHPASISQDGAKVGIRFKSLPQEDLEFLCDKSPLSWWNGVVHLDERGHAYIFATEILGKPLP